MTRLTCTVQLPLAEPLAANVARLWLDKFLATFTFIFLIPLRLWMGYSITDIVCRDVKLMPQEFQEKLEEALHFPATRTLFLLDSFVEFAPQVSNREDNELFELITSKYLPGAPVVKRTAFSETKSPDRFC